MQERDSARPTTLATCRDEKVQCKFSWSPLMACAAQHKHDGASLHEHYTSDSALYTHDAACCHHAWERTLLSHRNRYHTWPNNNITCTRPDCVRELVVAFMSTSAAVWALFIPLTTSVWTLCSANSMAAKSAHRPCSSLKHARQSHKKSREASAWHRTFTTWYP